jgi:hypothetical protein
MEDNICNIHWQPVGGSMPLAPAETIKASIISQVRIQRLLKTHLHNLVHSWTRSVCSRNVARKKAQCQTVLSLFPETPQEAVRLVRRGSIDTGGEVGFRNFLFRISSWNCKGFLPESSYWDLKFFNTLYAIPYSPINRLIKTPW